MFWRALSGVGVAGMEESHVVTLKPDLAVLPVSSLGGDPMCAVRFRGSFVGVAKCIIFTVNKFSVTGDTRVC